MLQTFRERLQGWLITFIIGLIVLGLGLFGLQNYWAGGNSEVIATVDRKKIYKTQFNYAYEQTRKRMMETGVKVTDATQALLKKEVLRALITQYLELKAVTQVGMRVSLNQMQAAIFSMPYFQENGSFSYEKFQQFLRASGNTEASFLSKLEQQTVIDQLKMGIVDSAFVMKHELEQLVALQKQTRLIDYLVIPQSAVASKDEPKLEAIQTYYAQHQAAFKTPEKVKVDYLLLSPDVIKQRLTIKDSALKQYYEEHKATFKGKSFKAAQAQIRQILISEKLRSELPMRLEQLAELTYTHPDSLSAAAKALDLPVQTSDFFSKLNQQGLFSNPVVIRAAFHPEVLTEGRNSDVIRLKDGSALVLRMHQYEPSKTLPLDAVHSQIVSKLKAEMNISKVARLGASWLDTLNSGQDITQMLKQHKLAWKHVKVNALTPPKTLDPAIWKMAFKIPGTTSRKPLWVGKRLPNGNYVLLHVKAVELGNINQLSDEEKAALMQHLEQQYGQLDYHFYLEGILKRAKIKVNEPY